MSPAGRQWLRGAALVAVGVGLLLLAYRLSDVLNPLLVALAIAYVLNPLVQALERREVPWPGGRRPIGRGGATVVVFAGFLLAFLGTLGVVVPLAVAQVAAFVRALPGEEILGREEAYAAGGKEGLPGLSRQRGAPVLESSEPFEDLNGNKAWDRGEPYDDWTANGDRDATVYVLDADRNGKADLGYVTRARLWAIRKARSLEGRFPGITEKVLAMAGRARAAAEASADELVSSGFSVAAWAATAFAAGARAAFVFLSVVLLIPFYTFFFLRGLDTAARDAQVYIPARIRTRTVEILGRIHRILAAFVRGRVVIALICAGLTWAGLLLCGVPYAFLLGLATGVTIVVPFLPVLVGLAPALLLLVADGAGWPYLVAVLVVFAVVNGIEGFYLTPKIVGKEADLHPVTAFVALFAGAELLGLLGAILAIPLAATVKILVREFLLPELKDVAGMGPGTGKPPK
ncbi:MAG: AI-2E family transporter [Planctomycetales bacterium]|nr:AI-2E family transporter [Planctomycetales bacterium]